VHDCADPACGSMTSVLYAYTGNDSVERVCHPAEGGIDDKYMTAQILPAAG